MVNTASVIDACTKSTSEFMQTIGRKELYYTPSCNDTLLMIPQEIFNTAV